MVHNTLKKQSLIQANRDFLSDLKELISDRRVQQMKNYIQHGNVSTFDHCVEVTRNSIKLCAKLRLRVDYNILILGAFLHDFYLYDWHITKHKGSLHGYAHPIKASENAALLLGQPPEVLRIIRTHMWPLTFMHFPTSKEGWVVCFVDKYVSLMETVTKRKKRS